MQKRFLILSIIIIFSFIQTISAQEADIDDKPSTIIYEEGDKEEYLYTLEVFIDSIKHPLRTEMGHLNSIHGGHIPLFKKVADTLKLFSGGENYYSKTYIISDPVIGDETDELSHYLLWLSSDKSKPLPEIAGIDIKFKLLQQDLKLPTTQISEKISVVKKTILKVKGKEYPAGDNGIVHVHLPTEKLSWRGDIYELQIIKPLLNTVKFIIRSMPRQPQRRRPARSSEDIEDLIGSGEKSPEKDVFPGKDSTISGEIVSIDGDTTISGRNKDELNRNIKSHYDVIEYCYKRQKRLDPNFTGELLVEFSIGYKGRVAKSAWVVKSTFASKKVENCIIARVKSFRFKPIAKKGGEVIVRYKYTFKK